MSRYDEHGLTLREREILNYIIDFKTVNGFAPTISEISAGLITSRSFVRSALYNLQDKGFIRYNQDKRRSIVVLRPNRVDKIS